MNLLFPPVARRATRIALLAGLLGWMLTSSLVWAQPPLAQPAQSVISVYLPTLILPEPPAPAGAPQIDSFTISSAAGPMAAEVELRWNVRNATSLQIEPDVGDVRGGASAQIYPVATTTYTLTASNAKGSVTANVSYAVNSLPTPNPLTVAATADDARAGAAAIGPAGGIVEASGADGTRYTLSVPPEALLYTEAITLTPVAAIAGIPFAASTVHAVSIAPEGLLFIELATLTITPPAGPASPLVGFAFAGAGSEFHQRPLESATALTVVTARSYGVALTPEGNPLATARAFPSDRMDALAHLLATTNGERTARGVAMAPQPSASDDDLLAPLVDAAYVFDVRPELQKAVQNPDRVDLAAQMYITWRSLNKGNTDTLRNHITEANLLLGEALRKAGELATERCNAQRPAQGFALQRYMGYAKRFGLVNTRAALEERLEKCWVFELRFDATLSATIPGSVDSDQVLSTFMMRFDSASGRIIGSAESSWGQIIHTQPDSSNQNCVQSIVSSPSTFDAAGAERGLTLSPVSLTSPNINVTLTYDPGRPSGMVTWNCAKGTVVTYDLSLWREQYNGFHLDELAGSDIVATTSGPATGNIVWSYQQTRRADDEISIIEDTLLTLEHKPEN